MAEQTSEPAVAVPRRAWFPRRFYLYRHHDVTGVSGPGHVADGVVWADGTVTVKWLGARPSEVSWGHIDDVIHVHGHDGATTVVWLDDEDAVPHQVTVHEGGPERVTIAGLTMPYLTGERHIPD